MYGNNVIIENIQGAIHLKKGAAMTKTLAMTGFPGGGGPVNSSLKAKNLCLISCLSVFVPNTCSF